MRPATSSDTAAPAWERRRLLAVLAAALVGAALLAGGLVYAVVSALNPPTAATTGPAPIVVPAGTGAQYRDSVAAKPMLTVPPEASRPGAVAAAPGPALAVPPATTAGPGGVPAGFPHTPAGAVGQLAAIDSTVLTGMNLAAADEVYRAWSLDIARDAAGGWVMTAAVRAFLSAAKVPELTPGMSVVATPVAGQVKGSDGPDWVVACVLLRVEARIAATTQVAFGHCERMAWAGSGTWLIEPSPTPVAPAPSTWPGTQVAIDAGWATWADPVGE